MRRPSSTGRYWAWSGLAALAFVLMAATLGGLLGAAVATHSAYGSLPGGLLGFLLSGALLRRTARRASGSP